MLIHKSRLSAYTVYLLFSGATSLSFSIIFTVNMVYQVEVAKLNPLQLVLVGTVLESASFICQVPTGVLADMYSRRLAVILGIFVFGLAFILEGSFPRFDVIVASQILFSVGLGSLRLNLPIVMGGALSVVIAVFLLFFVPENNFHPAPKTERRTWRDMGNTFLSGLRVVRGRPILITILLIALLYGLYSEGFDRLWTAHFLTNFTFPALGQFKTVVWFGILSVVGTLLTLGATEVVRRWIDIALQRIL